MSYQKRKVPDKWAGRRAAAKRRRITYRTNFAARGGPVRVPSRMNWHGMPEIKCADVSNIELHPGTSTNMGTQYLNVIVAGSAGSQRIGRSIKMVSYGYCGSLQFTQPLPNSTVWGDQIIRWAIVYDRQPDPQGTVPAFSEIYQDQGSNNATTNITTYSMRNENNKDRFLVLESHIIYVPPIATNASGEIELGQLMWAQPSGGGGWCDPKSNWNPLAQQRLKRLNGLETTFRASTNNIADIATGSLFMMAAHSSSTAAVCPLVWQGSFRTRFIEE